MKKQYLNWHDFEEAVEQIVMRLEWQYKHENKTPFTKIVGLTRGGLPLATALSHRLKIPMVALEWSTRDFKKQDAERLTDLCIEGVQNMLFVDDICDSGKTIKQINQVTNDLATWCVWISKIPELTRYFVDADRGGDVWYVFPHEI